MNRRTKPREIYKEIANWKLDSKQEDNNRYFYMSHDIQSLEEGSKCYVIGRKGTGKTAIAQHLKNIKYFDTFSKLLSLQNFPFNSLYSLENNQYTKPNQYITIWKYIIYSNLLFLMSENSSIDPELSMQVQKLFPRDPEKALSKSINDWVSGGFGARFFTFGIDVNGSKNNIPVDMTWIERVDVLEDIILEHIDTSRYFILFDELDEDYKYQSINGEDKKYLDLITGLFKAVQDIKSIFRSNGKNVFPVIFLREDIFALIKDPDKTKWSDFTTNLHWTKYTIQPLLAHRISKAIAENNSKLSFSRSWNTLFTDEQIQTARNKQKYSVYEWISRKTLFRPRDYIKYLQLCAKQAYEANYKEIRAGVVTTQDLEYSNYLRSEISDELCSVIPDVDEVLQVFSKIGKIHLSIEEFKDEFSKRSNAGIIQSKNPDNILKLLFQFGAIGNQMRRFNTNKEIFQYINPGSQFSFDDNIVIHRGLIKSLQIF